MLLFIIHSRHSGGKPHPRWVDAVLSALMLAVALTLACMMALFFCGCVLARPDLYGTSYMRAQWNQRLTPTGRTAYEESILCARWAAWQRMPSNYTPGSFVIADGNHWHCYSWPMKITSDPGASR